MKRLSHQELTDLVYDRIKDTPRYEWVQKNLEYHEYLGCGEWDVIAKVEGKELYHYYECKTWSGPRQDARAYEQFKRSAKVYNKVRWNFIEVANQYVHRVRLGEEYGKKGIKNGK